MLVYATTDQKEREKMDIEFVNKMGEIFLDLNSSSTDLYLDIESAARSLGLEKRSVQKSSVTTYNKIVEIYKTCKEAGVSISASPLNGYLVRQLTEKNNEAIQALENYTDCTTSMLEKLTNQMIVQQESNPIKRAFSKIKSFFVPQKTIPIPSLTQEEKEELYAKMDSYEAIDSQIGNYSIEKDLVPYITEKLSKCDNVEEVLMTMYDIEQDLSNLGLGNLVPQMQESITEAFKSRLPEQVKEEDIHLYVPDFSSKLDLASREELIALNDAFSGTKKDKDSDDIDKKTNNEPEDPGDR